MPKSMVRDHFNTIHAWLTAHLLAESERIARFLDRRMTVLLAVWFAIAALAGGLKILVLATANPKTATLATLLPLILPYALIALAPVAGYALVGRCFTNGTIAAQPRLRLAKLGRWSSVSLDDARQRQNFGMSGLLVSLVAGLLLSMVMRLGEYLIGVPAIPGVAPPWALAMFDAMYAVSRSLCRF